MTQKLTMTVSIKDGEFEAHATLPAEASQQQIDAAWRGVNVAYEKWTDKQKSKDFWNS